MVMDNRTYNYALPKGRILIVLSVEVPLKRMCITHFRYDLHNTIMQLLYIKRFNDLRAVIVEYFESNTCMRDSVYFQIQGLSTTFQRVFHCLKVRPSFNFCI